MQAQWQAHGSQAGREALPASTQNQTRPPTFHKARALRGVAPARQQAIKQMLLALQGRAGVHLEKLPQGGGRPERWEASGQLGRRSGAMATQAAQPGCRQLRK